MQFIEGELLGIADGGVTDGGGGAERKMHNSSIERCDHVVARYE